MKDGGDIFAVEFRNEFMAFFFGRDFYGVWGIGLDFFMVGQRVGVLGRKIFSRVNRFGRSEVENS